VCDEKKNQNCVDTEFRGVIPYGNALVQKTLETKDVRLSSLTDDNEKATI